MVYDDKLVTTIYNALTDEIAGGRTISRLSFNTKLGLAAHIARSLIAKGIRVPDKDEEVVLRFQL